LIHELLDGADVETCTAAQLVGVLNAMVNIPGMRSTPYEEAELNVNRFIIEYKFQYRLINEVLADPQYGITADNFYEITREQLTGVFNYLLQIPNLADILSENGGISEIGSGTAGILQNRRELAGLFPLTIDQTPCFSGFLTKTRGYQTYRREWLTWMP